MISMPSIHYPTPWQLVPEQVGALLLRRRLSFRQHALRAIQDLPLQVNGIEHIPTTGPALLLTNHYAAPGFHAWWIALGISACVSMEVHWIVTSAWTHTPRPWTGWRDRLRRLPVDLREQALAWITPALFHRLAAVYGFTSMPPMPPRPQDVAARAAAVRHALAYVRNAPQPVIGLAPEGSDAPGGVLASLPPGAGRFMLLLVEYCSPLIPVGVYEAGNALALNFGPPFHLTLPPGLSPGERDRQAAQLVLKALARLLPTHLRGRY
jgi:1-acyl-sn-glycerol-3-phosphate acyltransferase